MHDPMGFLRRLRHLLGRSRWERELAEEMSEHVAALSDGRRFGNLLRLREEARDAWGWRWLDDLVVDTRLWARTARRAPGFYLAAILILALGTSLDLTFFQLANATQLQPLAVRSPETLVLFERRAPEYRSTSVPYPLAAHLAAHGGSVLSAVLPQGDAEWVVEDDVENPAVVKLVTDDFFAELGHGAHLGQVFEPGFDGANASSQHATDGLPRLVLGHEYWRWRFGGDPTVVGRILTVEGTRARVIGVLSERFPGLTLQRTDLWALLSEEPQMHPGSDLLVSWDADPVDLYARLAPETTAEQAREALRTILAELHREHPRRIHAGEWLEPRPGSARFAAEEEVAESRVVGAIVGGLALLVLLATCANVGGMLVARSLERGPEMALRAALGAGGGRLLRQVLTECALLAALASGLGLAVAIAASRLLAAVLELPRSISFAPDGRSLLAVLALTATSCLALAALPLLGMRRSRRAATGVAERLLGASVRAGTLRVGAGVERQRGLRWLVAGQVWASCLILVIAATLALGVRQQLLEVPRESFAQVAAVELPLESTGLRGPAAQAVWSALADQLAAHPAVEEVSLASHTPLGSLVELRIHQQGGREIQSTILAADERFFETMSLRWLAGGGFSPQLAGAEASSVVLGRRLAMRYYGSPQGALGQSFPPSALPKDRPVDTVVGVIEEPRLLSLFDDGGSIEIRPLGRTSPESLRLLVRTREHPRVVAATVQSAVRSIDPRLRPTLRYLDDSFTKRTQGALTTSRALAGLAGLVLLISAAGVHGLVSYAVARRTREIAIRSALGAGPATLLSQVVRQFSWPVALGALGGLAAGQAVILVGGSLGLPGFADSGVSALALALLLVTVAAAVSAVGPTLRALQVEPVDALRAE
jgi:predicted permease